MKIVVVSDSDGRVRLPNNIEANIYLNLGDVLSHEPFSSANTLNEILSKFSSENAAGYHILGNVDDYEELSDYFTLAEKRGANNYILTQNRQNNYFTPGRKDLEDVSLISWGHGAGIGGITGLLLDEVNTISTISMGGYKKTADYSGVTNYNLTNKLMTNLKDNVIILSHMPPHSGIFYDEDYLTAKNLTGSPQKKFASDFLNQFDAKKIEKNHPGRLNKSMIKGVELGADVGCLYFLKFLSEYNNDIDLILNGHIENGQFTYKAGKILGVNPGANNKREYALFDLNKGLTPEFCKSI